MRSFRWFAAVGSACVAGVASAQTLTIPTSLTGDGLFTSVMTQLGTPFATYVMVGAGIGLIVAFAKGLKRRPAAAVR